MSERELEAIKKAISAVPSEGGLSRVGDWFTDATLDQAAQAALTASRPLILEEAAKVAEEWAQERWAARAKTFAAAGHEVARRIRSLSHDGKAPDKEGEAG